MRNLGRNFPLVCLLVVTVLHTSAGFAPVAISCSRRLAGCSSFYMQENEQDTGETSESESSAEITGTGEQQEEDPEIVALKQEIAGLESELKTRKSSLSYSLDQVEENSKAGYARAVAEMENMRRVRSTMNSSSKSSATAGLLADFLPVYDRMNSLQGKYGDDDFGSKYGGLSVAATFAKMGVKEYTVKEGEPLNGGRIAVVESEPSPLDKDTVVRQLRPGLELDGNVVRPADCVSSSGADDGDAQADETNTSDESSL